MAAVVAQSGAPAAPHSAAALRRARRERQALARSFEAGRLRAAFARIGVLESKLAQCEAELDAARALHRAAAEQAAALSEAGGGGEPLAAEITERLLLIAPVLEEGLAAVRPGAAAEVQPDALRTRRRNVACHVFTVPGKRLGEMQATELNAVQRSGEARRKGRLQCGACARPRARSRRRARANGAFLAAEVAAERTAPIDFWVPHRSRRRQRCGCSMASPLR